MAAAPAPDGGGVGALGAAAPPPASSAGLHAQESECARAC